MYHLLDHMLTIGKIPSKLGHPGRFLLILLVYLAVGQNLEPHHHVA